MAAGAAAGVGAADGAVRPAERLFPGLPRAAADAASGGGAGGGARAGPGAGLRGFERSRYVAPEQALVAAVRDGGTGPAQGELVTAAASGPDSRGFFYVHSLGCCGGEEDAYLFKRGGWEYAVSSGYSRNVNPDIAAELGDYSDWEVITVTSPDGESFTIR